MNKTKVMLMCTLAAISYGIIHDQITAHLCIEYFTIAHPPLFHTDSPTLLGLCWGIAATIGIGVVLGAILAEVSQSQGLPPYPISSLARSLLILLFTMALAAFLAGLLGFELSRHSMVSLPETLTYQIPLARHDKFMAVWFAHGASYLVGLAGGAFLILRLWRQRGKPRVLALIPRTPAGIARALTLAAVVAVILYLRFTRS
jgi:hypothetical protein